MNLVRHTCPCGHSWVAASAANTCPVCTAGPSTLGSSCAPITVAQSQPDLARAAAASRLSGTVRFPNVPGFEIAEEINRGGMGVIFRARQLALNRTVALKVLPPQGLVVKGAKERFGKEIHALARLNHPNVVTVYHSDLSAPLPYLAMEYVPGIDLLRLVKKLGPLPVFDAVYYIRQAAEGVQYAHEQGLIHRDIKPSNIMVSPGPVGPDGKLPRVKVLDMGVARVVAADGSDAEGMTEPGTFLGTPDFVSPQQAEDPRRADARSDVFSLGGTLYFLLTGEVPFPAVTIAEKLGRGLTGPRPSAAAKRPDVPPALDELVRKMLAAHPDGRPQSAAAVVAALDNVLRAFGRPRPARPLALRPPENTRMAPNFFEQHRAALARLAAAVQARVEATGEHTSAFQIASDKAERDVGRARKANAAAREKELADLESSYAAATADIGGRFDAEQFQVNRARDDDRNDVTARFKAAEEKATSEYNDKLWRLDSMLEAGQKQAKAQLESLQRKAAAGEEQVAEVWAEAEPLLARARVTRAEVEGPGEPPAADDDPINRMQKAIDASRDAVRALGRHLFPKVGQPSGLLACIAVAGGITAAIAFTNSDAKSAAIVTAAVGVVLGAGLWIGARVLGRAGTLKAGAELARLQWTATRSVELLREFAGAEFETEQKRLTDRHTRKRRETGEYYKPLLETQKNQYQAEIDRIVAEHEAASNKVKRRRKAAMAEADADYTAKRDEITGRLDAEASAAESVFLARMGAAHAAQSSAWEQMADEWQQATTEVAAALEHLRAEDERLFPYWDDLLQPGRELSAVVPPGIRLGDATMDLKALPGGIPEDERLAPPAALSGVMPAFLPFPDGCSVVLKARDEGRAACVSVLQAMMLRFLTGLPPGKVRFTIIDPVGLGENFAAFMHLADHDEKLVTSQIWTEPQHIEKRLTDLTDHIASVIQKYLRNQYKSIEEYNQAAGEVAEPYRVLVIANFPTNFTPDAAKRLVSIANSGPSCGVCTLVGVDTRAAMPRDFVLADLEQPSFVLGYKDGKFAPKDPALAPFALTVDTPPDTATVAQLVQRVGKASKDAVRVEVPFEYIAPKPDEVWAASAAKGFDVAVGRAGATRKQVFSLGRGTAQHALIAGKTGSGKSTLLHALITNLALTYSPEEAELYLIDFKEGVEFRPYAEHRLPHARVVAIESEREFGLSVIQRLVGILQERGEKFRDAGVNDLASYRNERPGETIPRILLIVDEFQQFFVEDDKLAQEAALLLDRLVRQGRAFGIHVLLGSQTLGGAYSLARSTIDQMAVRVALQCSDADAQLILSKDNSAARLLSRPGEAIYNDQNGLVEGNDPFQVVWLSDDRREQLLGELEARAGGRYAPPLVFEGNASADIAANRFLSRAIETPSEVKVPVAWLGDPVAIKEPTAVPFRAAGASNLLVIGQNEEAARGLFAASLVGLAGQVPADSGGLARRPGSEGEEDPAGKPAAIFTILDGTPDDSDEAEYLRKLAAALPHRTTAPDRSGLPAALADLTAEIEKRQKGEAEKSPRFLLVFGVQRFRELRKSDDDFGFGRRGAEREVAPAERFHTILRDGPAVNVHVVAWCDSLTNLNRAFDRPLLREFGMRVLFQMSPTDSSTLMDTPAASRLGRNRALLLLDDQERPEKFRPYRVPTAEWVAQAAEQLRERVGLNETGG